MRWFNRGKSSQPVEAIADNWSVFEGQQEGQPLIARFNVGAKPLAGDRRYGIQIGVAVPFNEPTSDGLPTEDESEHLLRFEELLEKRAQDKALLVGILTTANMREFVLYTGSGDWIEQFHHQLQADFPSHDVQVMAQTDPKWSVYREFVR